MTTLRRKLFGDLRAHAGAFFAVWMTVFLGLMFYGATYPAGVAMINSIQHSYEVLHFAEFAARFEAAPAPEVLDAVRAVPGVDVVQERLSVDVGLALSETHLLTLRLISIPDQGVSAVNTVITVDGSEPSTPDQLLLLKTFAAYHNIASGSPVRVVIGETTHELTVSGLAFSPEFLVTGESSVMPFPQPNAFTAAYMRYSDLAALLGMDGQINEVTVTLTPDADGETVRAALESALEPFNPEYVVSRAQTPSGGVIDANIKGNMAIAAFFSAMFLVISGLVMAVLLARLIDGERRRIGTMRALGLTQRETILHYLGFPILIGLSGAVAGSIAGYLGSYAVAAFFVQTLASGTLAYFVNSPQWGYIAFGILVMFGLALLAGLLPTLHGAQTDPGLALRPITPKGMGSHARLTLPGLPLAAQQAFRNILRAPVRSIGTLIGVILGCTVILAATGLADSPLEMHRIQYTDGIHYDFQVIWSNMLVESMRRGDIDSIPGVTDVEMALIGTVTTAAGDRSIDTFAVTIEAGTDYLTFTPVGGDPALSNQESVWIGHNLARVLNVNVGDTLTMTALDQTHEAPVGGIVNQGIGSLIYLPAALMRSWIPGGLPLVNAALVRVDPAQIESVRAALSALPNVMTVEAMATTTRDILSYLSLWINFSYVFAGFGFVLTLVIVFNTITVNLLERSEELMIMRSTGARMSEIAAVITWETLSVAFVGFALSVPLGWWALRVLLGFYDLDFFGMIGVIRPASYIIAAVGVFLVIAAAEVLSLRGVRRSDMGAMSKTLSM